MMKSILSPKQLYLHTKRSKQIKNQWHRDDPCITTVNIVLLIFCALLLNLSNPLSYNPFHLLLQWFLTSASFILIHFIMYGIGICMITKTIAERYLRKDERSQIHGPLGGHLVEPMYSFDIHCNGFFPIILFNYFGNVSTLVVSPLLNFSDMFLSLVLNDAIRFESMVRYHFQSIFRIHTFVKWTVHYRVYLLLLPDVPRLCDPAFHYEAAEIFDPNSHHLHCHDFAYPLQSEHMEYTAANMYTLNNDLIKK